MKFQKFSCERENKNYKKKHECFKRFSIKLFYQEKNSNFSHFKRKLKFHNFNCLKFYFKISKIEILH